MFHFLLTYNSLVYITRQVFLSDEKINFHDDASAKTGKHGW